MRADRGVHLHRHLGPCLAGQRDQPVDSRGLRPALRCVTWRTLTRTLNQLRSISCCRSLTPARSPSLTALKILRPSRRTSSSQRRQSTSSQASPSKTGRAGRRSSVRSPRCPTCPSVPASASASPQRLTCPRQRPCRPGHPPVSGQLCRGHPGEIPVPRPLFPLPFGRRPSLPGHPVPPGASAPLTIGLPPSLHLPAPAGRTLTRFPRSARMRPGPGRAPSIPRGRRCSLAVDLSAAAACRLSAASP